MLFMLLMRLLAWSLIMSFFVYIKVEPHRSRLFPKYQGAMQTADKIFGRVLSAVRTVFKAKEIGYGLSLDTAQLILFGLLLLLML